MKTGIDRKYTAEFRESAVKQVTEGRRSMTAVARSLEMSNKTLANWVYRARKGPESARSPRTVTPVSEQEAELSRLRQENARLKVEKEIKKNGGVLCARIAVKYAWIEKHRGTYATTTMCELLSVSRSD